MSNYNRILSKHPPSTVPPASNPRSQRSGMGRGGGTEVFRSSDPERALGANSPSFAGTTPMDSTMVPPSNQADDSIDMNVEPSIHTNTFDHTMEVADPIEKSIDMSKHPTPRSSKTITNPYVTPHLRSKSITPSVTTQGSAVSRSTTASDSENINSRISEGFMAIDNPVITQPIEAMDTREVDNPFLQENQRNYSSSNIEDIYDGPNAKPITSPLPRRVMYGRYTWRVHAPKSDSAISSIRMAIQEVWDELLACDPSLVIYPWADAEGQNPLKALTLSKDCPTITRDLLVYFQKAYSRPAGGTYYLGVRMGHTLDEKEFRRASAEFFDTSENKLRVGFWRKSLQHENTVEIGYLLGSTPFMEPDRLAAEISYRSNGKLEIGCRWHVIAKKTFESNFQEAQRYKALHIEVKYEQQAAAFQYISGLFSSTRTSDLVFNSQMRFVPLMSMLSPSDNSIQKAERLRERQGVFLHQLKNTRIYTINNIDFRSVHMQHKSLRELIMAIPVNDTTTQRLFLSCDTQSDGAVVLTFLAQNDDLAYQRAQNLLAHLRFTNPAAYSASITKCFMISAQTAAESAVWDDVTKSVTTPTDAIFQALEDTTDNDLLWITADVANQVQVEWSSALEHDVPAPARRVQLPDEDSVSTFRYAKKSCHASPDPDDSVASKPPARRPSKRSTVARTDTSVQSELTLETLSVRMDSMYLMLQTILQQQTSASTRPPEHPGAGDDL